MRNLLSRMSGEDRLHAIPSLSPTDGNLFSLKLLKWQVRLGSVTNAVGISKGVL